MARFTSKLQPTLYPENQYGTYNFAFHHGFVAVYHVWIPLMVSLYEMRKIYTWQLAPLENVKYRFQINFRQWEGPLFVRLMLPDRIVVHLPVCTSWLKHKHERAILQPLQISTKIFLFVFCKRKILISINHCMPRWTHFVMCHLIC